MNDDILHEMRWREVTRLCHFTPINNLPSIFQHGILSQEEAERCGVDISPVDDQRFDGRPNHVCLSVMHPNAYMMQKKLYPHGLDDPNARLPIVLIVDPYCVDYADAEFCSVNATTSSGKHLLKGLDGFKALFKDSVPNPRCPPRPADHAHQCPTDLQAEILIHKRVSTNAIRGIVVPSVGLQRQLERRSSPVPIYSHRGIFLATEVANRIRDHQIATIPSSVELNSTSQSNPEASKMARANRPVFLPAFRHGRIQEEEIEFAWFPGFSPQQKQRSIAALQTAAAEKLAIPSGDILEVSRRSPVQLGQQLSAFNLTLLPPAGTAQEFPADTRIPLESAYQGSKVFANGSGPYPHLFGFKPRGAKRYMNEFELATERVAEFRYGDITWRAEPDKTVFYDFLYITALQLAHNEERIDTEELLRFEGFTDIEFNPKRSVNCQARSCALFVVLSKAGRLDEAMIDIASFEDTVNSMSDSVF